MTDLVRWQHAADRARVPWPVVVAAMDDGTLEAATVDGDRLVHQADDDALRHADPPPGTVRDRDGFRIVPGTLRAARADRGA